MRLLEYQTKRQLSAFGVAVPSNFLVTSLEGARHASSTLTGKLLVKPQIRGSGNIPAVQIDMDDSALVQDNLLVETVQHMFRQDFFMTMRSILVEEHVEIQHDLSIYLITDDLDGKIRLTVTFHDDDFFRSAHQSVNVFLGLREYQVRDIAGDIDLPKAYYQAFTTAIQALFRCYIKSDARLLTVDTLGVTPEGRFIAIDAQMDIDDSALFRQTAFPTNSLTDDLPLAKYRAQRVNISYIEMEGDIGCIANGAGLCLTLIDSLYTHSSGTATPSSLLDIGSITKGERLQIGLHITLNDKNSRSVLIALFGANMTCVELAQTLLDAIQQFRLSKKAVVYLTGIDTFEAKQLIEQANIPNLIIAADLDGAVNAAVQAAKISV